MTEREVLTIGPEYQPERDGPLLANLGKTADEVRANMKILLDRGAVRRKRHA